MRCSCSFFYYFRWAAVPAGESFPLGMSEGHSPCWWREGGFNFFWFSGLPCVARRATKFGSHHSEFGGAPGSVCHARGVVAALCCTMALRSRTGVPWAQWGHSRPREQSGDTETSQERHQDDWRGETSSMSNVGATMGDGQSCPGWPPPPFPSSCHLHVGGENAACLLQGFGC